MNEIFRMGRQLLPPGIRYTHSGRTADSNGSCIAIETADTLTLDALHHFAETGTTRQGVIRR